MALKKMKIKAGLEQEYARYVELNQADEYSEACVDAGERVGNALDEGKTATEALEAMKGFGLTGFIATMAVKGVAHFHPRGDEVRIAYNDMYGAKSDARLVNPTVLNVSDDGKMTPEFETV